jgi:cell division protein ZapA (FtsZ GTPase activity inhibitor)
MNATATKSNSRLNDSGAGPRTITRVGVEIAGERYTIRGEAEAGYIAEVARTVDERMRELQESSGGSVSRARLAVLTAINIADELMQERMQRPDMPDSQMQEFAARARQLVTLLDEGLIGDTPDL